MYLTESERKRIKALYEASSASDAGSYTTPMGFKAERPEIVGELPDEMDMDISDDEGVVMDVDELIGMLGLSEDDDKERMRKLHKDNSVVVEQEQTPTPTTDQLITMGECLKAELGAAIGEDTEVVFPLSCFECYMMPVTGMFPPTPNPQCTKCLDEASVLGKIIYDAATSLDMDTLGKIKDCVPSDLLAGSGI